MPQLHKHKKIILVGVISGVVLVSAIIGRNIFLRKKAPLWNWCPRGVNEVVLSPENILINDNLGLRRLCSATLEETIGAEKVTAQDFQIVMKARNQAGEETYLEYSPSQHLYKTDGKFFASTQLLSFYSSYIKSK